MEMNKFWLYLGIILACTGIGTTVGIVLNMIYFWNDIKMTLLQNNEDEPESNLDSSQFYNEETLEEMK